VNFLAPRTDEGPSRQAQANCGWLVRFLFALDARLRAGVQTPFIPQLRRYLSAGSVIQSLLSIPILVGLTFPLLQSLVADLLPL